VVDIKLETFTIKYTAVSPNPFYGITVNYAAFFDPNINIYNFYTNQVGSLGSGEEKQRSEEFDITYDKPF
jgi:hypothetical protein